MYKYPAYWLIPVACFLMSVGIGCQRADEALPEVVVDRSECAKCRMLISDGRFAGMLKTDEYLMFDDLGCMLKYQMSMSPEKIHGTWVRDYYSDTWIQTQDAIFYRHDKIETPMGYGYIGASKLNPEPATAGITVRLENSAALQQDFQERFLAAK